MRPSVILEEQMTQEQRDTQKSRIRKAKRPRLQKENSFDSDVDHDIPVSNHHAPIPQRSQMPLTRWTEMEILMIVLEWIVRLI